MVRTRDNVPPASLPLTPTIEGEQFANAYFDTETKIKMLVFSGQQTANAHE